MSEPAKEEINAMGLIDEIILTVKRGLLPADPGWRSTIQTLYDHAQVAGVDPREDIVIVYGDHVEGRPIWFKANRKLIGTLHRDTGIMTFGDEIKHWEKPTVTEEQQEYESGGDALRDHEGECFEHAPRVKYSAVVRTDDDARRGDVVEEIGLRRRTLPGGKVLQFLGVWREKPSGEPLQSMFSALGSVDVHAIAQALMDALWRAGVHPEKEALVDTNLSIVDTDYLNEMHDTHQQGSLRDILGPEEHMHDERGRPPIIDP